MEKIRNILIGMLVAGLLAFAVFGHYKSVSLTENGQKIHFVEGTIEFEKIGNEYCAEQVSPLACFPDSGVIRIGGWHYLVFEMSITSIWQDDIGEDLAMALFTFTDGILTPSDFCLTTDTCIIHGDFFAVRNGKDISYFQSWNGMSVDSDIPNDRNVYEQIEEDYYLSIQP